MKQIELHDIKNALASIKLQSEKVVSYCYIKEMNKKDLIGFSFYSIPHGNYFLITEDTTYASVVKKDGTQANLSTKANLLSQLKTTIECNEYNVVSALRAYYK